MRRFQDPGQVPHRLGSWPDLIATVAVLPDNVPAEHLPDFPYLGLPRCRRPTRRLWEAAMPHLRRVPSARPPSTALSCLPPAVTVAGRVPRLPAASAPEWRRPDQTPQWASFYATVARVTPAATVAWLLEARTAAPTKGAYRAAESLYEASCVAGGMQP